MTQATTTGNKEIDTKALRSCLGHFATGVAVVTTHHDGKDLGITVNSFTSLSLKPPLVLWCLARTSRSYAAFSKSDHFIINVLAADQVTVSNRFAFREGTEFPADVPFTRATAKAPLLTGCSANFECRKNNTVDAGDHIGLVGEVLDFRGSNEPGLVYQRGQYAIANSHPSAIVDASAYAPQGFLESTVRPSLERITQRFEDYFDNELRDAGINSKESRIIGLLLANGPLDAEQIANLSLVSGASLQNTLVSLTKKGLITEDQKNYGLEASGKMLAKSLSEKLQSYKANALGPIANAEADELQRMLDRLSEWIQSASSPKHD